MLSSVRGNWGKLWTESRLAEEVQALELGRHIIKEPTNLFLLGWS